MKTTLFALLFLMFSTSANAGDMLYKFMPHNNKVPPSVLILTDESGQWCPPHAPAGVPSSLHWKTARMLFPKKMADDHLCWIMSSRDTVTLLSMDGLKKLTLDINTFVPMLGR